VFPKVKARDGTEGLDTRFLILTLTISVSRMNRPQSAHKEFNVSKTLAREVEAKRKWGKKGKKDSSWLFARGDRY
jgi:hypothetical protein